MSDADPVGFTLTVVPGNGVYGMTAGHGYGKVKDLVYRTLVKIGTVSL